MGRTLAGAIETAVILVVVTAGGIVFRLNVPSVGFLFLVAILFVASRRPLPVATGGSILATLSYNFFFFAPQRTLTIEDPANWFALGSFLATSLLANRLVAKETREAERARISRGEVEALYGLSVELLRTAGEGEGIGGPVGRWLTAIGAASGGLILFGASPQHQRLVVWRGEPVTDEIEEVVAGVGRHRRLTEIPSRFGRDLCAPLMIGTKAIGALVVRGSDTSRRAVESVAALVAVAVERERFLTERVHLEALRESDELKTSLLQAVAHDLNSPLTVLTVETEAIQRKGLAHPDGAAHLDTIREQLGQLKRRIDNLLSLARAEAGILHPRVEPTPPADLFRAARENLAAIVRSRPIRSAVDPEAPDVLVDPSLALEIVVNLVENAHRASAPGAEIELRSRPSADHPGRVWLEVLDRGGGFSAEQQRALRRVGFSELHRGLGLDLARTLATLNGGSVEWFPRDGGGTLARIDLPAALPLAQEAP